jgi:protein involved in polysaccharide export with SLBB domain
MKKVFALLFLLGAPAAAQKPGSSPPALPTHRLLATRGELEHQLAKLHELERVARPPQWVATEISYTQGRLRDGDFQIGDRVLLRVQDPIREGNGATKTPEQQLSDTFTVDQAQALSLPLVGVVSLHGVLRSEIESYLATQIGTQIRDPEVHARALIGVTISGGVLRPGYYAVPADALVGMAITVAGGGSKEGKITDLKIVHDGRVTWKGDELRRAIAAGKTLDELQVQPGDEIAVGQRGSVGDGLRFIAVVLSIPVAILSISRLR